MEFGVLLVTLACYGLAGALWWYEGERQYLFSLLSGQFATLASPLWIVLYGLIYNPAFATLRLLPGPPVPWSLAIASAWIYPLPALLVFFLYQQRWWFPGYLSGLFTYGLMLLYHLVLQLVGTRTQSWVYTTPLSLSPTLVAAGMGALISLGLLYTLLLAQRYSLSSQLLTLLPATLLLSLAIHGVLGAPLWVPLLLRVPPLVAPPWVLTIGLLVTLALLAWAIHIAAWSLKRLGVFEGRR